MFCLSERKEINVRQLKGVKVAVLGAARSGISVASLLARAGASVLLSDVKSLEELNLPLSKLNELGVEIETGHHSEAVLETDLICISPGLPLTIPVLRKAKKKDIPVVGEIEVASWFCHSPIIAITGSNGKTTTTTLAGEIFRRYNEKTVVAGNIGKPFSEYVSMTAPDGIAILEISSFQLETIHTFHPKIAVIMNLTDNHLDRYPDFESYATAKLNILKNMTSEDVLIFNADDDHLVRSLRNIIPRKLIFSLSQHDREGVYWRDDKIFLRINGEEKRISLKNYHLKGIHNRYNMMVAALIASLLDVPDNIIEESIEQFEGIEHRLEMVREYQGVVFVNDSKATTVDSLAWALQSFDEKIVLIVGGKDKGGDFRRVVPLLKKHVRAAILIGKAANRIQSVWNGVIPLFRAESLKEAVEKAFRQAQKGDVVLLSPACSSFDMFRDYEDRGRQFKQAVRELN